MHSRKEIKAKFKDLLTRQVDDEYQTLALERVYISRRLPLPERDGDTPKLPAICIYTPKEESSMLDNLNNKRTAKVFIECSVEGTDDIDLSDKIDQIASEIEDIIVEEPTLEETVNSVDLVDTEELESADGDALIGGVRLTYEVVYYAEKKSTVPESGSELSGANVNYNGGAFGDEVPLPQEE